MAGNDTAHLRSSNHVRDATLAGLCAVACGGAVFVSSATGLGAIELGSTEDGLNSGRVIFCSLIGSAEARGACGAPFHVLCRVVMLLNLLRLAGASEGRLCEPRWRQQVGVLLWTAADQEQPGS